GRAQAAKSAGFRLGTDTILGFAVGGLCPRFKPMRSNLAHTALRLCPRRLAICPALWPLAQSFLRSATLAASHMTYCLTPKVRLLTISLRERHRDSSSQPEHDSKSNLITPYLTPYKSRVAAAVRPAVSAAACTPCLRFCVSAGRQDQTASRCQERGG